MKQVKDAKQILLERGVDLSMFAQSIDDLIIPEGGRLAPSNYVPPSVLSPRRRGRITNSQFGRIKRGQNGKGFSEGAESYLAELLFEMVTGKSSIEFTDGPATRWGRQYEKEAIDFFEFRTGKKIKRHEFILADGFNGLVGGTPDGVGEGGFEAKCPYGARAHFLTILRKKVPSDYEDQVTGHILVSKRDYCDFWSYDPRIIGRDDLKGFLVPVERNEFLVEELTDRLYDFEEYYIKCLDQLEIDWRAIIQKNDA